MKMEKLPEEFKKKWLEALRSGEYKQGKDHLCLGVAGAICGLSKDEMDGLDILSLIDSGYARKVTVSKKATSLGYPEILLATGFECTANNIADMNDEGKSFSEIADYIEQNL